MTMSRRSFFASSTAAASVAATRAHAATSIDFGDPQQNLDAYVRMRNRGDGQRSFTRYSGTFFVKPEGETAIPAMGIEGMSWGKCEKQPDGTYLYNMQEAGYHTAYGTTEIIDAWDNPVTGITVQPRHYRSGQTSIFTPTSVLPQMSRRPEGLEYNGVITPATVVGDTAWGSEELYVKFPNPRDRYEDEREWSGPYRIANSLASHAALIADLEDDSKAFVPSTLSYTTLNSWRPWMKMGQTPGIISWRLHGRKFERAEDINDWLLDRVAQDHPDLLA